MLAVVSPAFSALSLFPRHFVDEPRMSGFLCTQRPFAARHDPVSMKFRSLQISDMGSFNPMDGDHDLMPGGKG